MLADAAYYPTPEIVITACHFDRSYSNDDFFSEFDAPLVEEFRLLAAIVLSGDDGLVSPIPLSMALRVPEMPNLAIPAVVEDLKIRLLRYLQGCRFLSNGEAYPPFSSPIEYVLRVDPAPLRLQRRIFEAIDMEDYVLTRGLRTLLRGLMLASHPMFGEEAIYPLHVALDASFSIFRRQLEAEGKSNATAYDVAARFEDIFGEERSGRRYFEDFYGDRLMAQHPESRLGVSRYVPGTKGELIALFKDLREVYRYFLLGEVINRGVS